MDATHEAHETGKVIYNQEEMRRAISRIAHEILERNVGEVRFRCQQEGRDPAGMGGCDGSARSHLILPIRCDSENLDTGRRYRDLRSPVGLRHQLVVDIRCRHTDDARVGSRIERRRSWTGIADGGNQHDATRICLGQHLT